VRESLGDEGEIDQTIGRLGASTGGSWSWKHRNAAQLTTIFYPRFPSFFTFFLSFLLSLTKPRSLQGVTG
jgi:hypothetical protein